MSLFKKGTKPYSIFGFKCPKCHTGDLYHTPTFSFRKPFDMYDNCPNCGLNYLPEPGFYYGAMFIGYIFTAWLAIGLVIILHWVLDWSLELSFGILIGVYILFFISFFRLARAIWLNINYKYDSRLDPQK